MNEKLRGILSRIFGTRAAGWYILLFAIVIGVATFVENDFGTSSAQKIIYKSWWFELLLALFAGSLIYNIYTFKMIPQKKWALLIFHSAMILILIGAGITRYFGYEGMMHIREGESADGFLSRETYLMYDALIDNAGYKFDEPVLFATLGNNHFERSYKIKDKLIKTEVLDFIPNPKQIMETDKSKGKPTLKIVIAGMNGREEYFISPGEVRKIRGILFNFAQPDRYDAVNLKYEDESLFIKSEEVLTQMVMATMKKDTLFPRDEYYPLKLRSMYSDGKNNFVFGAFNPSGVVKIISGSPKMKSDSRAALRMKISVNGKEQERLVYGQEGLEGRKSIFTFDDMSIGVSYGAKMKKVPFSIKLKDFIMDRYPGTNSAMSYASEVVLHDDRKNFHKDFRIFMNNILTHDGYRFFQSSYDQDEKGTYLSVNHDYWGTMFSYLGYALLTIGLLMIFFTKNSRFRYVNKQIEKIRAVFVVGLICMSSLVTYSQTDNVPAVSKSHAKLFSRVIVQDQKGRMKPMHTLTRELMRKIYKKESYEGYNADQVVLSMYADPYKWDKIPLIKVSPHEKIQKILGTKDGKVPFSTFFNNNGQYILRDEVRRAYGVKPIDRGIFEKDIIKIDERVNIANMIYTGRIFKILPVPGHPNDVWESTEPAEKADTFNLSEKFFPAYQQSLVESMASGNYDFPDKLISELTTVQRKLGGDIVPSQSKVDAEIFLNNLNVFNRLTIYYLILGLLFLVLLFASVFMHGKDFSGIQKWLFYLVLLGFFFHTLGLGLRWYVSGRAPWSNGYESMIYIAWTTSLAGILFTRKSLGGLAATMILASTILFVAMLSYLDPEITPLVPVLRSYWLTIHVSMEAGSYGFLMLGAIIAIINLVLMIFLTPKNKLRIKNQIKEMTYLSELTITGGLIMLSIGTYLGGVWANESWGRYWGWDAKETWALVTILVYAFILHMRIIPKMYSLYSYNVANLFGFASVVMTYFGVNYYLSGLHSYAAGDPVPIPTWVYIATASVIAISLLAWWKKRSVNF